MQRPRLREAAPEPALHRAPMQPLVALQTLLGDARCNQAYSGGRAPPRSPPAFPLAGGAICARLALALAGGGPGGVGRARGGLWPQPCAAAGEERGARREEAGPCRAAAGGGAGCPGRPHGTRPAGSRAPCLAQQLGLRAEMRQVVQLPAALRGPEAESLGVGSGPPPRQ